MHRSGLVLFRVLALVGLGLSAVLLESTASGTSALCAPGGGCDTVRGSAWAAPLGVPMPILGVLFFAAILAASLFAPLARARLVLAVGGAAVSAALLAIQAWVIGAFCGLCVGVDLTALALGALAVLLERAPGARATSQRSVLAYAGTAVLVCGGGYALSAALSDTGVGAGLPPEIAREQRPGAVTVVEFLDFECPACRAQHGNWRPVLAEYGDSIAFVVKNMPLPQHAHAYDAARAFCCADAQGRGDEMVDALFRADELSATSCEAIAGELQLDVPAFRECVVSERTSARLRSDSALAAAVGVRALPTYYVGAERFVGIHAPDALRRSIERALSPTP